MVRFIIEQTSDYEQFVELFVRNELEFSEEEPVPTDLVKCWKLMKEDERGTELIGGLVLARRQGEYIIDGIAVEPQYRKRQLGKLLLQKAVDEVRALSGESIYLVARAPGFFKRQGFNTVPKEGAPYFFECLTCPQYGITCHPEVMKRSI